MTQEQWVEVTRRINANWPHQVVPDIALAKWYDDLRDLSPEHVTAAVEALYRDGREFPPNGAQIRGKVVELTIDAPDWAEVLRWLERLNATGVTHPAYSGFPSYQANAKHLRERMPAQVAAFIDSLGPRQVWDAFEQEGGGEARLRDKWLAFLRRTTREQTYRGLPDADLPTLERANRSPALLGDALREIGAGE